MPDPHDDSKRIPEPPGPKPACPAGPAYAELRCRTNFSFLEGASHPDELVVQAALLGYQALAITDRNSLAGVVRAHAAAKQTSVKLIIGAEVTPADGPPLLLWAHDRAAYGRLCRLLTLGRSRGEKGDCELRLAEVYDHAEGLLAGAAPNEPADAFDWGGFRDAFADRGHLMVDLQRGGDDRERLAQFQRLSDKARVPLVACGNAYYHTADRQPLHDVLTAIRTGTTVAASDGGEIFSNAQRCLRTRADLGALFRDQPAALARTIEIAERCRFSLAELRYEYPDELSPDGKSERDWLRELAWRGAAERYPSGVPAKVEAMIRHELRLIEKLRYEAYFLTVWDIVRYARSQHILCQGRGSAANSAVCYCLGVTSVDPEHSELLFERFISEERNEPPDIDIDIEHERREEVLQYVYQKYGRDRAALAATVITYRVRSAVRDAGKALGLSLDRVDALAKQVDGWISDPKLPERFRQAGVSPESPLGKRLLWAVEQLVGFPRHLSQHVGGMVMTRGPLCELTPIENAAMPDRTIVQWDKDDLDELSILKVDCLALGMLTALRKAFDLIALHHGKRWTLATLPAEDPEVYDMICRADTMGVFQIESRAQMTMLPRLKPRKFYDLVIEVAIVRPGPIQGDMVHPYLKRRNNEEPVSYPNDAIRAVLERTLGVPIFQEQAMKLAEVAAGFTPGEADQLRRAMASWRKGGEIEQYRQKLLDGMRANGLSDDFAERCYRQLQGFGEYGFPESHAASFALLVYASCWLKCHHPAAFCAALLNSQPMGFYAPSQLVHNALEHGVEVRPVDVNHSDYDCTLEPCGDALALRLGLRMVIGLSATAAERIVASRATEPYATQHDLRRRAGLDRKAMNCLAEADALRSMRVDRRQALWQALAQEGGRESRPLLDDLEDDEPLLESLPRPTGLQETLADYRSLGLTLRAHPISFYRDRLTARRVLRAQELQTMESGRRVSVAGLVLLRQRPATAKGITFATLEDETGLTNLIIRPQVWERHYAVARRNNAWIASGELQHAEGVIHLIASRIEPLAPLRSSDASELQFSSRDFR